MITTREKEARQNGFNAKNIPATNDHPQRANPATAKAAFKIKPMLIGRFENRCFLFFSVVRIIILTFFLKTLCRIGAGYE